VRIGPYLVDEDPLAVGGQATIYRACLDPDAERIALKVVTPSQNVFVHDGKVRRLQRETEALRRLDHPNAPKVLDADPDGAWYAMPLAMRDLGRDLEIGRIPWQALRAGLLGVASVIAKAHKLELVHRDLHDANVLIYPDRWCVGDWGFVYNARVDRLTRQLTAGPAAAAQLHGKQQRTGDQRVSGVAWLVVVVKSAAGGCRAPSTSDATRRTCVRTG
jgi:serine/threonine protein kinase